MWRDITLKMSVRYVHFERTVRSKQASYFNNYTMTTSTPTIENRTWQHAVAKFIEPFLLVGTMEGLLPAAFIPTYEMASTAIYRELHRREVRIANPYAMSCSLDTPPISAMAGQSIRRDHNAHRPKGMGRTVAIRQNTTS